MQECLTEIPADTRSARTAEFARNEGHPFWRNEGHPFLSPRNERNEGHPFLSPDLYPFLMKNWNLNATKKKKKKEKECQFYL